MWDFLLLATASCAANPFGNGNIFVQQEIIFTIARFIRTCAGGQCHNGKQSQNNFLHVFSFLGFWCTRIIFTTYNFCKSFILHFLSNLYANHVISKHQNAHRLANAGVTKNLRPPISDVLFVSG